VNFVSEETKQILHALLEGQKEISANIKSLDERVQRLEGGQKRLEDGQKEIKSQLTKMESSIDLLAHKDWQNEREINFVKKQIESHIKEV
jgi:peptidoglycan hydrolase CwlO-like protein